MLKKNKKAARQKQRAAHALLQQSKLALQVAMFERDPDAKAAALDQARILAESAKKISNDAAGMVR